jgi:hypothetical protein
MTTKTIRTFEDRPAKRERVPLLIGLVGPSGGGKTWSGLELLHGIQEVTGGDIGVIDTGAKNSAGKPFTFRHLPFSAPFGPLDYLAAIQHLVDKGVRNIMIDSMSHEHEGPGGVLEMHDAEAERLAGLWKVSAAKTAIPAWNLPKSQRRELLNALLQMPVNFVFCFRAKEKIKIVTGKDPVQLGWQPIAGEEFVFEMSLNCLLPPGANGVPEWNPEQRAETQMIKLPQQFRSILTPGRALSVEVGRELAQWAEGGASQQPTKRQQVIQYVDDNKNALTHDQLQTVKLMIPGAKDPKRDDFELLTAVETQVMAFLAQNAVTEADTIGGDPLEVERLDRPAGPLGLF